MSEFTNQKGFNLVELLVAMGILLAGTLAVASMLMTSSANSMASNQDRGGDTIALELVEALRGEMAQMSINDLGLDGSGSCALRLQKPVPGGTVASGPYEYQDSNTPSFGTVEITGQYVQRVGNYYVGSTGGTDPTVTGSHFIYKWKIYDVQNAYSLPNGMLKLEVTVGWNDKQYGGGRYPCTGDPGDPGDPNRSCARCTKMTSWVIHSN